MAYRPFVVALFSLTCVIGTRGTYAPDQLTKSIDNLASVTGTPLDMLAKSIASTGANLNKVLSKLVDELGQSCQSGSAEGLPFEELAKTVAGLAKNLTEMAVRVDALATHQSGSCLAPFHQVGSDCLYVNQLIKKSWQGCRTLCNAFGGDLAIPSDILVLRNFLMETTEASSWLGASDIEVEGNWRWLNGLPVDQSLGWSKGEPNNSGNQEDCLHFEVTYNMLLNDAPCGHKKYCICQDKRQQ